MPRCVASKVGRFTDFTAHEISNTTVAEAGAMLVFSWAFSWCVGETELMATGLL